MNVHVVAPHFHPVLGGVETRVLEIGRCLRRRGHRVTVHTTAASPTGRPLPPAGAVEDLEVRRYPPVFRAGYFLTLFRPRIGTADVLDLHGYPHLAADLVARSLPACPRVVTPHGLLLPHPGASRSLRRIYDMSLGGPTLRGARRVILVTPAEREQALRAGVDPGRLRLVPNGVSEEALNPAPPLPPRELGPFDRYILFLGRLHRDKRPLDLIRAFQRLAGDFRDAGLVLAGPDGGDAGRVGRALGSPLSSRRGVRLGGVSEETKRRLLAGCAMLALPSRFEAQGIVLLEAWAQGRPVVASDVGGAGVLVRESDAGLLQGCGDIGSLAGNMARLLEDPGLARAMGERGRAFVAASYTWSRLAPRAVEVLEEAAQGEGRAGR